MHAIPQTLFGDSWLIGYESVVSSVIWVIVIVVVALLVTPEHY